MTQEVPVNITTPAPVEAPPQAAPEQAAPSGRPGLPGNLQRAIERDLAAAEAEESSPAPSGEEAEPSNAEMGALLRGEKKTEKVEPPKQSAEEVAEEEQLGKWIAQRKRLAQERKALKDETEKHRQELEAAKEYRELQKLKAEDPFAAFEKLGIDADTMVKRMVEEGEKHRPLTVEERLERMEQQRLADIQEAKTKQEQAAQQHFQQEIEYHTTNYKAYVSELIAQDAQRYELIKTCRQEDRVWNTALDMYQDTGKKKFPTPEEVLDRVETDLRTELTPLLSTSFFKSLQQEYSATKNQANQGVSANSYRPASITTTSTRSATPISKSVEDESDEEAEQAAKQLFMQATKRF